MALKDLEPAGFSPVMADYASMTQGVTMYAQGFRMGEFGVWLRFRSGQQTLIGYGLPAEALAEAARTLEAELEKVRRQLSNLSGRDVQFPR